MLDAKQDCIRGESCDTGVTHGEHNAIINFKCIGKENTNFDNW